MNFRDGLEEGVAKEYGEDGRIITLITYKNGFITERELINRYDNNNKKNGLWKYFYPSGMVMKEGYCSHGVENGYFKEYDMEGNHVNTAKYADGIKLEDVAELVKLEVRKDYYPDGKVKIAATYNKQGNLEGVRREYSMDGTIERSYIFRNGIMIGEGIVTEKGEKDGFWKEYFDDGKLRAEGKYNKDLREGAAMAILPVATLTLPMATERASRKEKGAACRLPMAEAIRVPRRSLLRIIVPP